MRAWSPTGRLGWPPTPSLQRLPSTEECARLKAAWRAQAPKVAELWNTQLLHAERMANEMRQKIIDEALASGAHVEEFMDEIVITRASE